MGFISTTLVTNSATVDPGYELYFVDATSTDIFLQLPDITDTDGQIFIFVRIDQGPFTVTLDPFTVTQTINGSPSVSIAYGTPIRVVSFGEVWYLY